VWVEKTPSLICAAEEDGSHAGSHARYDDRDRRTDELHRVVDSHARGDGAARGVDIESDLLTRILHFEIEQLLSYIAGGLVGDFAPEKDLSLFKKGLLDLDRFFFFVFGLVFIGHGKVEV